MAHQEMIMEPYRLVERIGVGGMGMVYHGQHTRIGREAAVKILPSNLALEGDFLKRFEREASSIASLEHPNILPVWEYGDQDGIPYLVMPLIRGGSLKERLQAERLSLPQVSLFLNQMAEALDYAHGRGIVHRDVKPANMLLNERGHLYLADFGIAKALQSGEGLTRTGVGVGTPEYMAPEQAQGRADKRSDLYALTIILYQMLTGKVPYSGNSVIDTLMKHINEPLPLEPLRAIIPPLSPAIEQILRKGTAKNPNERHQSGHELALEFAAAIGARPDPSLPPGIGVGGALPASGHTPPPGYTPLPGHVGGGATGQSAAPGIPPPFYVPGGEARTQIGTPPPGYTPGISAPSAPSIPHLPSPTTPPKRPLALFAALAGIVALLLVGGVVLLATRGDAAPPATIAAQATATVPAPAPTLAAQVPPSSAPVTPTVAPTSVPVVAASPTPPAPTATAPRPTVAPTVAPTFTPLPAVPIGGTRVDFKTLGEREVAGQSKRGVDPATGEFQMSVFDGLGDSQRLDLSYENFVMEVDVRKVAGPADAGYGIIFRSQEQGPTDKEESEYLLFIRSNGDFSLFWSPGDGTSQALTSSYSLGNRPSPIKTGEGSNRLTITCQGEAITVAVNGQTLGVYKGALVKPGKFGLVVAAGADKATTTAAFNNLRVLPLAR